MGRQWTVVSQAATRQSAQAQSWLGWWGDNTGSTLLDREHDVTHQPLLRYQSAIYQVPRRILQWNYKQTNSVEITELLVIKWTQLQSVLIDVFSAMRWITSATVWVSTTLTQTRSCWGWVREGDSSQVCWAVSHCSAGSSSAQSVTLADVSTATLTGYSNTACPHQPLHQHNYTDHTVKHGVDNNQIENTLVPTLGLRVRGSVCNI